MRLSAILSIVFSVCSSTITLSVSPQNFAGNRRAAKVQPDRNNLTPLAAQTAMAVIGHSTSVDSPSVIKYTEVTALEGDKLSFEELRSVLIFTIEALEDLIRLGYFYGASGGCQIVYKDESKSGYFLVDYGNAGSINIPLLDKMGVDVKKIFWILDRRLPEDNKLNFIDSFLRINLSYATSCS